MTITSIPQLQAIGHYGQDRDEIVAVVGSGMFRTRIVFEHRTPRTWAVMRFGETIHIDRDRHAALAVWAQTVETERGWQACWEGRDCPPDASPSYRQGYKEALDRMAHLIQQERAAQDYGSTPTYNAYGDTIPY